MKWAILMLKHCSGLFWNINQSNLVTLFLAVKLVYEHRGLRKAQTLAIAKATENGQQYDDQQDFTMTNYFHYDSALSFRTGITNGLLWKYTYLHDT